MEKRSIFKQKRHSKFVLFLQIICLVLAIAVAVCLIIFKPNLGIILAPVGNFFAGLFSAVATWPLVRWLLQLELMQYVALLVTPAAVGILVGRLIVKYIAPLTGLIWILTSLAYGCACYFLAEDVGLVVFCIMLIAANVLLLVASMCLGGNSFAKSLGVCTKQLIILVPAALILGAIYLFAGNNIANTLITVGQYFLLATSLAFQIWFSDPIRSL